MEIYILYERHTMRREQGKTPNGNKLNNCWVLRDQEGRPIDYDQYRHDLLSRNKLTVIEIREE